MELLGNEKMVSETKELNSQNQKNLVLGFIIGGIIGLGDGFGGLIASALAGSIICMFADIITYRIIRNMYIDEIESSTQNCMLYSSAICILSAWGIGIILSLLGFNNIALIGIVVGFIVGPSAGFQIRKELKETKQSEKSIRDAVFNTVDFQIDIPASIKLGVENNIRIIVNNPTETPIHNIYFIIDLPTSIKSEKPISKIDVVYPQLSNTIEIPIIPMSIGNIPLGTIEISFEINNHTYEKKPIEMGIHKVTEPEIDVGIHVQDSLEFGIENPVKITVTNHTDKQISNIQFKTNFPKNIKSEKSITQIDVLFPQSSSNIEIPIIPMSGGNIPLGAIEISFEINNHRYEKEPIAMGTHEVIVPEIDVDIHVQNPLKLGIENPVKITVTNLTDNQISNIRFKTKFPKLIKCDESTAQITNLSPNSSRYTAIFIVPRIADNIDLGNLDVSIEINGNIYEKEPIAIGTHEAIDVVSSPIAHTNTPSSHLNILRETEFYQGFIRFKMSVANTADFVVNDVTLDFDFDDVLLQINRHEPDYPTKNGKIFLGNISGNSSKTIAIYLDPMMCSKGTDINCQINYKDAKGQPQSTRMEPKKISVVCPIMKTDSDINIGRLKEFVENLSYRDSKVYQLQDDFDIEQLKNITREVVQKHDVKHIRTLHTKDEKTCEIWYYGKTKVNSHNIVIRITISGDTQSIELFAATPTPESLAGLLAEVGREVKSAIDAKTGGDDVKQVLNITIKDSIIQRSNLLSFCDINGNCTGDVVIEDSIVQRSEIGFAMQADTNVNISAQTSFDDSKTKKKNKITEDVVIPNKETTPINKNLDKMNKYGAAALRSVKLLQSDENKNPIEAWDIATKDIFGCETSNQKKGCPKNTFLGLCEEGLIKGVPKGNYTNSKENKKYALKAVEILKNNPHLASNRNNLWNEVVDEPKAHNSQMDVVIALWNNDFIDKLDVVSAINKRFVEVGNPAQIPLLRGDGSFEAKLSNDGIHVDNLGNLPFLPWKVFAESVSLLDKNGGNARRGDAMNSKLGDEKLSLNSIEGHIAHVVYGKEIGDIVFRRITPIACILIWAKICQHKRGELLLSNDCTIDSDCTGDVVIEDSILQRSDIGLDVQIKDNGMPNNNASVNSCPACEMELPDGAKFCLDCGENLIK